MHMEAGSLEVIFFDAAGTLFEVRGSVGEIYSAVARRHGVYAQSGVLDEAFARAFRRKSSEAIPSPNGGDRLAQERQWWLDVVQEVISDRMSAPVLQRYFEDVFEVFRTAEAWQLFPDTLKSLVGVRSAGYRLGIISNFDSRLHALLENLHIGSLFQHVTISWEVGAAKPDARIFQNALQAMNVPASRAVHVGDSPLDDFAAARSSGLRAVLLDRRDAYQEWSDGPRIRSLLELRDMLRVISSQPRF